MYAGRAAAVALIYLLLASQFESLFIHLQLFGLGYLYRIGGDSSAVLTGRAFV